MAKVGSVSARATAWLPTGVDELAAGHRHQGVDKFDGGKGLGNETSDANPVRRGTTGFGEGPGVDGYRADSFVGDERSDPVEAKQRLPVGVERATSTM